MADEKPGGEDAVKEVMEEDKDSEQDEESEGEDSDDEEYFEVECIISRKKQNGIFLYRVRWKGYPPSNDTWEPVENLEVVKDMVVEFDKREEEKTKSRQEERRLRKLRMEGKKLPGEESSSSEESSDDDKLLSEDVRFFKQLEKNKLLALDGTDLYSKVKSRTAVLAGKKRSEDSKGESTASSTKPAPANVKKAGNRPHGGDKKNRGQRRKCHVNVTSDSSDRESTSDSEGSKPPKKAGSRDGQRRGKARKRPVSTSSGGSGDSDDSLPLARCKSGKSGPKCDRSPPKKNLISESDHDKVGMSDVKADSIKSVSKQFEDTNISDSQRVEKRKKKPRKLSSDSDAERLSDLCSKTDSSVSNTPAASKAVSLSKTGKEFDTRLEKKVDKTEGSKISKTEKSCDLEKQHESLMPAAQTKKKKDAKRLETTLTNALKSEKKDASKELESFTPALKENTSASPEDMPALAIKPQPRDLIPVLEKFGRQVPDFSGTVKIEKEEKATEEDGLLLLTKIKPDTLAACSELPKETSNADAESMDCKDSEKKYIKGKSKERGKISRKRKRDTESEHVKAVNEGAASPVKAISPQQPTSPADTGQVADIDSAALSLTPASLSQKSAHSDSETDDLSTSHASSSSVKKSDKGIHPLKIAVPKLKTEPVRLKPESPKSQRHSPLFLVDTVKREQEKVKGEMLRSASRTSVVKEVRSTSPSVGFKKDRLSCSGGSTTKSEVVAKLVKTEAADSRCLRPELAAPRVARPELGEGSSPVQMESKPSEAELLEYRKKSGLPASSSSVVPASATDTSKDLNGSVAGASAGSVKDASGRDHKLPGASGRDSTGLCQPASRDPAPTAVTGGFTSSLYSGYRDSLSFPNARTSVGPAAAGRDSVFSPMPARDPTLTSVSPARDITLPSGYTHLTSSSSSGSSPVSYSPRSMDARTAAGTSRLGIAASPSISGKENADRSLGLKLSMSSPKMGSSAQPLDTILNSSLYAVEGEKSKHGRGLDSDFDTALHRTDLEYLEKLLLPPVTPMELSNEELRQAVVDGNYYLVRRALACAKQYNLNLTDSKGYTLLMNAVLKGYDDIIMQLLLNGADSEVQVNGVTSLMLAVEHAECSTVYMLLEMGAQVNTRDVSGETALFRAVMRGDKQILNKVLEHGADFAIKSRITGLDAVEVAKLHRLADVETTLLDHIQRVVQAFEEQVNLTVRGTARLVERLFPHHCVPLYENDTISIQFKFQPITPSAPGTGCLLFIAHARFNQQEVKCRLYGQCAVVKVTLNGVEQPCLTEESNFVLMCHPLITGYNDLVIHTKKDITSRAKLIICAYKAQLIWR